jgi:hypothetical protein
MADNLDRRPVSRRALLAGGAGAAVLAGVGLATPIGRQLLHALPFVGNGDATLDRTPMQARIGARFTTRDVDERTVDLFLASIDDLPPSNQIVNLEGQFVARFTGPQDRLLTQNTYRFDTEGFGSVELFVVPVGGPGVAPGSYEALFNRIEVQP